MQQGGGGGIMSGLMGSVMAGKQRVDTFRCSTGHVVEKVPGILPEAAGPVHACLTMPA